MADTTQTNDQDEKEEMAHTRLVGVSRLISQLMDGEKTLGARVRKDTVTLMTERGTKVEIKLVQDKAGAARMIISMDSVRYDLSTGKPA